MACGLWVAERSSRPRTTAGRPHANRPCRDCSSSGNVSRFAGKPSLRGALVRAERYRRRRHARELQHANPGNVPARGGSPATAASVIRTRAGKEIRPASGRVPPPQAPRSSGRPSARLLATAIGAIARRALRHCSSSRNAMQRVSPCRGGVHAVQRVSSCRGGVNEDFPPGVLEKCCRTRRNLFDFIVVDSTE